MTLLDTHVLIWSRFEESRLGRQCRERIAWALRADKLAVSAFSFWEVALLHEKGRMALLGDVGAWRARLLDAGLQEVPVDGEIAVRASALQDFHADPADRIIVATALGGHRLVTADRRILGWNGSLDRQDART